MPVIKDLRLEKELQVPQPKNAPFAKLPRNECAVTISSGGKTYAHVATLISPDMLGGLFDKYVIMSPNVFVDPVYKPLIAYIIKQTGQKREEFCHSEWDPSVLTETMHQMRKTNAYVRKHQKELGATRLYSCHITVDDYADRFDISKGNNSPLIQLFTKGRHSQCSTTVLTQRWKLLNSAIRINCHSLWIGRVTSSVEAKDLAESFGAAAGSEKNFLKMLKTATEPAYGFLYIVFGLKIKFYNSYKSEFRVVESEP